MLIRKIEVFLRHTRIPPAMFGRLAMRDPQFVFDLRRGRTPRPCTEMRVEHFMNTYREEPDAY
jgi:hypothetical protein